MATPVPPPSPRHLRLLRLLLSGLVLGAVLRGAAAGRPDEATCPGSLDCALKRRARCPPGAHICGPCLQPFQEDHHGLCVPRVHRPLGEGPPQPRLEDEIDFLAQELARQEAGRWQLTALSQPESPHGLLETAATLGLSERGQGPDLGLASTRGAPTPTPHTSLGSPVPSGPVHMSPLEPRGGHVDGLALAVLILACSVAGVAALVVAAFCWCRLQRDIRLTQKADYAAPQVSSSPTTPRISPGDQRLAHSAEVYHYQHQRQQMRCLDRVREDPAILPPPGIKSLPRSWTLPPPRRRMKTGTSRCTSAQAWPRPGRWRCATRCLTTPRSLRPCHLHRSDPHDDAHPLKDPRLKGGEPGTRVSQ